MKIIEKGKGFTARAGFIDMSTSKIQKEFFTLNKNKMKHLEEALELVVAENTTTPHLQLKDFITINKENHSVCFKIQDGPIKEVGENGCQASDMLDFVGYLFHSLNKAYPCKENDQTIKLLEEAAVEQEKRTADREARKVEGLNKA